MDEWWTVYQLEPWGELRADLNAGIVAAATVNIHVPKGKRGMSPHDFLPQFWETPKTDLTADQTVDLLLGSMGGGKPAA